jgi:hypothetical protein
MGMANTPQTKMIYGRRTLQSKGKIKMIEANGLFGYNPGLAAATWQAAVLLVG